LKRYTAKKLTDKFPEKSRKHDVNKLLKKLRDTGTVDRATKHSHNNRPVMCEICCEFFYLPAKQCCKFPAESDGERILKIDQHLAKLTENVVGLFFESQCNISLSVYPTIYLPIYLSHYLSIYLSIYGYSKGYNIRQIN